MLFAQQLTDALRRRRDFNKLIGMPIGKFARDVLGVQLWSRQEELNDLVSEGHRSIQCKAGHGVGKTMDAALIAMWALATWRPAPVVITTAPTFRQVKDQLWKEIRYRWNACPDLRRMGEAKGTRIQITDFHYAHGFSTNQPERFQGIHNPRLMVIVDEANGFPNDLHQSIKSCLVGEEGDSQLVAIGNAVVPYGWFYEGFENPNVKTMSISSREHPNVVEGKTIIPGAVTGQWISDLEFEFRNQPAVIKSRIDAEFPGSSKWALVERQWIKSAYEKSDGMKWPSILSCDIARNGENLCVASHFAGARLASQEEWGHCPLTDTARRIKTLHSVVKSDVIVIDDDGMGAGVTDILRDEGYPVVAFNGGHKATEPGKFYNRISEAWWRTRVLFENSVLMIGQQNHTLETQLSTREWTLEQDKRIRVEKKDKYCKRTGFSSPDHADSFVMGVWQLMNEWKAAKAA